MDIRKKLEELETRLRRLEEQHRVGREPPVIVPMDQWSADEWRRWADKSLTDPNTPDTTCDDIVEQEP